ncbi:putative membrane protein YCR061W [Talaromyces islandicus]|uniref:Putative membrane protein YCR061W n=1 Tax=Talaromyces islandicus TaxID=28573 RepID=A0A0U1LJ23_TALIS|nr:putative membrane protein YCR061W [Talaromyces islandicus]
MKLLTGAAYAALFFASLSIAHGDHESMDMDTDIDIHATSSTPAPTASASQNTQSYFSYGQHSGTILAHIALMTLSWCFVLPAAVLLSIGRSHLALPSQFLFLVVNGLGLVFGIVYNSQTPDLYENNAHHKIGWIVTWVVSVQVILAVIFAHAGRGESKQSQSRSFDCAAFLPVATDEHEYRDVHEYCSDHEYSQETEVGSSSIRSPLSSSYESQAECDEKSKEELQGWFYSSIIDRVLLKCLSNRVLRIFNGLYDVIDRIILPFGFIAIATGAVTYGGLFHGIEIFNGLAHFIKGGIFFWYGILTLSRFIGAWADLGWAWNRKPPACVVSSGWKAKVPSGEFVESFVIWLYGVTNVFLEHLAGWGKPWTANDLEHVSISVMFFGGGLVGMLFESRSIRDALNNTIFSLRSSPTSVYDDHDDRFEDENWQPPQSQGVPLNPMPALIILLLGMIMGSHHQDSMTSTMVHKQWGNMLVGFAIARAMTYFLLFLRPPTSYLPARPPTEIVAGFCLMSGGLIFMLSARDVIEAMEFYELDAMFTFTVGMGFTAFIMSLVVLAIAIKAWAVKRERLLSMKR